MSNEARRPHNCNSVAENLALRGSDLEAGPSERLIPLRNRKGDILAHALVDVDSYEKLSAHRWCLVSQGRYAGRNADVNGKRRTVLMHREILMSKDGVHTDHISGDGLDNRMANLRTCSISQNMWNKSISRANKSGFKGVYWGKTEGKWRVQVKAHGKVYCRGPFHDISDAVEARRKLAELLHGPFMRDR